jgi:hypothetical protein
MTIEVCFDSLKSMDMWLVGLQLSVCPLSLTSSVCLQDSFCPWRPRLQRSDVCLDIEDASRNIVRTSWWHYFMIILTGLVSIIFFVGHVVLYYLLQKLCSPHGDLFSLQHFTGI